MEKTVENTVAAKEAQRAYKRQYRRRNRDRINAQQRDWYARNPDKVKEYQKRYWERKAGENARASWSDYNIDKQRRQELRKVVLSGEYAGTVLAAAVKADEKAAGHIILSVVEGLSYDRIEFDGKLGRCPLGRTNFYGARRLFFHYLDIALKDAQ